MAIEYITRLILEGKTKEAREEIKACAVDYPKSTGEAPLLNPLQVRDLLEAVLEAELGA